jgi:prepilin-type processing-associated H-X9-DG protein
LLTVIAIIGILAAILIPTIGLVRKKARLSASTSNLRQIHLALSMFDDGNRDCFPQASGTVDWIESPAANDTLSWAQQLFTYTSSKKNFTTPGFERSGPAYFLSVRAGCQDTGNNEFVSTRRDRIQFPAQHVLAGETNYTFGGIEPDFDKDDYAVDYLDFPMPHGKQAVVFADGHVAIIFGYEEEKMTFRYDSLGGW